MNLFDLLRNYLKDEKYNQLFSSYVAFNQEFDQLKLEQPKYARLQRDNKDLKETLTLKEKIITEKTQLNKYLHSKLDAIEFGGLSRETIDKLKQIESRDPVRSISYRGRYIGTNVGVNIPQDVRNWCLVGQNDYSLQARVKSQGAMIEDLKKEFPEKTFHQICDEAVRLIHANNFLTYVSDKDNPNYKSNEFWSYAIESAVLGIGDCNSDAVLRYVLCRIAGVPAQLLRIVAGIAGKFGGHATLYYYNSIKNSFEHLNSTTEFLSAMTLQDMLNHPDNEQLKITAIWFSFNENFSWNQFTSEAKTSFAKQSNYKIEKTSLFNKLKNMFKT